MPFTYDYPRPAVTTDVVAFTLIDAARHILLIQRAIDPGKGQWAFPGGFVDKDEDLMDAARRELAEETGLTGLSLHQFHTFGEIGRDPRGHTISVAYTGFVSPEQQAVQAADDAADARWFPLTGPPPLAFDHDHILEKAVQFIKQHPELREALDLK